MFLVRKETLFFLHRFLDNKKLKQGHVEMGIRYANFAPISNRCACILVMGYQERYQLIFKANVSFTTLSQQRTRWCGIAAEI
ncbi:hypothetical protein PLESHI_10705 [Plesiomonas shigelloides 302-73]|uniref:Uncharacterized protein n=1 Tax=Plesiomonas shigelloides 302-73 TaxID=1315976 RepID=R8AQ21_PLESH|nr:hypothetical protein PLESHI_10705 [Plesiomonas shigelloides 302-73]